MAESDKEIWEIQEDKIEDASKNAADDKKGNESHAEDAAKVLCKGFAVSKEQYGAFTGSLGSFFILTIKYPAKAAVTKIINDGLDGARNGTTNCTTVISTNSFAGGGNSLADLTKNSFDGVSGGKVDGDGSEALFDDFLTLGDWVVWEFAFRDTFGHHGDLAGLVAIGGVTRDDNNGNNTNDTTNGETDKSLVEGILGDKVAED